jgi:hypothetical protein
MIQPFILVPQRFVERMVIATGTSLTQERNVMMAIAPIGMDAPLAKGARPL